MPRSATLTGRRPHRGGGTAVVIVGAGQAGAQAAITLREHGFRGRVLLIGEEGQPPYQRPPLSKALLAGGLGVERVFLRPAAYYAAQSIELLLHSEVEGIDRRAARIHLAGGGRIGYDRLLLATGARARTLDVPGARRPDVHYLRTLQDALRLRESLAPGRRVAIIGGGYIGLEVAASASASGARVTVIEAEPRLLTRVTTPPIGEFFAAVHRRHGVELLCGTRVDALEGGERLDAVATSRGGIAAELAVVGVGAVPNVQLASAAGLECDDGIVVDAHCRTSDPNIFAAGDCTRHPSAWLGHRLRLESVQNAVDQATAAALNIAGAPTRYAEVPWFWSQQYDYKLQAAGTFAGHDETVVVGDREAGRFALRYHRDGVLIGVDAVNMPREYMQARQQLARQPRASPADALAAEQQAA
jgi:3-phenylpropionate/trans-cinnamate dioxygenase ferredoxin reductase subunit